jgi:hypothetical protein
MSGPLDEAQDATPLTPEEREGLIPSHVTLRSELNELEQQNILEADAWASLRRWDPVNEPFARKPSSPDVPRCLALGGNLSHV